MASDNAGVIWVTRSYVQCGGCTIEFTAVPDNGSAVTPSEVEKEIRKRGWRRYTPTRENALKGDGWVCPACAARQRKGAMNGVLKTLSSSTDRGMAAAQAEGRAKSVPTRASATNGQFDPLDESPYEDWELRKS